MKVLFDCNIFQDASVFYQNFAHTLSAHACHQDLGLIEPLALFQSGLCGGEMEVASTVAYQSSVAPSDATSETVPMSVVELSQKETIYEQIFQEVKSHLLRNPRVVLLKVGCLKIVWSFSQGSYLLP